MPPTILYDASCGLCRRAARRLGWIAVRRGYRLVPLQRRWVRRLLGEQRRALPDSMLLLLPCGRVLSGIDVHRHVAARIWWARPAAWLLGLPFFRWAAARAYAWLASNRRGLSRACGLDGCRNSPAGP